MSKKKTKTTNHPRPKSEAKRTSRIFAKALTDVDALMRDLRELQEFIQRNISELSTAEVLAIAKAAIAAGQISRIKS